MKSMRNKIALLSCFLMISSLPAFAGKGEGAGVRGGGGALCEGNRAYTLESYAYDPTFLSQKNLDATTLQERVLAAFRTVDPNFATLVSTRLSEFGPIESWEMLESRERKSELIQTVGPSTRAILSLIFNDDLSAEVPTAKTIRAWDEKWVEPLRKGCEFIQLSLLLDLKPKRFFDTLEITDAFEKRLLELHEATYAVLIEQYEHTNPSLVREILVAALKTLKADAKNTLELRAKLELAQHFKENANKTFRVLPTYASKVMWRSVVRGFFSLTQSHATERSRSFDPNVYCPLAVTMDFDGHDGFLLSSHIVQNNTLTPKELSEARSPLKSFTVAFRPQGETVSDHSVVRKLDGVHKIYVSRSDSDGSNRFDTIYSFRDHALVATVLLSDDIQDPKTIRVKKLQTLDAQSATHCEYNMGLPQSDVPLLWNRLLGEFEW